jgi:hypothetical protein
MMTGSDIGSGAATYDLDEELILAALRHGSDEFVTEIVSRYGAERVLESVGRLDLLPYAEGWLRYTSTPNFGGRAESRRSWAVRILAGKNITAIETYIMYLTAREAYVFEHSPSFYGSTLVKVADYGGRVILSGYIGGRKIVHDNEIRSREVTTEEWHTLRASLDQEGFWNLPETGRQPGFDGETYSFAGYVGSRHHRVERWCPKESQIENLATAFMALAMAETVPKHSWPWRWVKRECAK